MTRVPHTDPRRGRGFLERFGATILQGGIAPVPTTLYFYQAELGLSPQEVWFIGYILAHKWDEDLPYPSLAKMEARTGMSRRNLLRIKDSLVGKGLLALVPRFNADGGQESNAYDFTALFEQLEDLIRRDGPRGERGAVADSVGEGGVTSASPPAFSEGGGVTKASPPGVTEESRPRVTPPSLNKESDHEEPDHEEATRETGSRHIPSEQPTGWLLELGVDSPLQVSASSVLVEEGSLKGYVHKQEENDTSPNANQPTDRAGESADAALSKLAETSLWQEAQVRLRLSLSAEDFNGVVRYASLLAYDGAAGTAVLGLPNAFLCRQITIRLAVPIAAVLSQISGRPVQVHAVVQPAGREAARPRTPATQQPPHAALLRPANDRRTATGRSRR